jgi:hypothetical protein
MLKTLQFLNGLVVFCCFATFQVESKRRRNLSYEEEKTEERFEEIYTIITSTYLIVLAPVVLKFLYSVLSDPALPDILRALMKSLRSELSGYIGKRTEH